MLVLELDFSLPATTGVVGTIEIGTIRRILVANKIPGKEVSPERPRRFDVARFEDRGSRLRKGVKGLPCGAN
jgi:hypothetical protein